MGNFKNIMKKLITSFCVFAASAVIANTGAYAGSDADYAKTVKADGGVLYSLAKSSKSVMHILMPCQKCAYTNTLVMRRLNILVKVIEVTTNHRMGG